MKRTNQLLAIILILAIALTIPACAQPTPAGKGPITVATMIDTEGPLLRVELPLARPAILAGLQTSVILNISVATIGAVVGVNGFGTLIINGIRADDIVLLLKGAIPVSLLALTADSLFMAVRRRRA